MTATEHCRSCGAGGLRPVLSLGVLPLADRLVRPEDVDQPEPRHPLDLVHCPSCSLVQILETVPPEVLFGQDYPYYSSFSESWLEHARRHAAALGEERGLGAGSLVVEVASNDGYLLQNFVAAGVPVLGIDPVPGPAAVARERGVETLEEFFGQDLARRLRDQGRSADVLLGNNVLAHVADLNGFVAGVATLLKDDGIAVFEFPYVGDLVAHAEFDTIYHEHLCYFSLHAVQDLFRRHGLTVLRVERLPTHGGSLRVRAARRGQPEGTVDALLAEEVSRGMHGGEWLADFADRVEAIRTRLPALLRELKGQGHALAAYGAAAKGATLLNACGIGADLLDFVVDRNVHKQGWRMPGVHLPITGPEELLRRRPGAVLLLAWNFQEEILRQQQEYREAGGRFVIPIPEPTLL